MFDSAWSAVCAVEKPMVGWQALRNLRVLLASAPSNDQMAKETHGFAGGPDATDAELKTVSIRTVPSDTFIDGKIVKKADKVKDVAA